MYGRMLGRRPEPINKISILVPPPFRIVSPDPQPIWQRFMVWWDVMAFTLQKFQIVIALALVVMAITFLGILATCLTSPADPICVSNWSYFKDIVGGISGATDDTQGVLSPINPSQ